VELTDQLRIRAPRDEVFAALNDPEILRQAIPGCESLEATSPTEFKGTVSAKVGPLAAKFTGAARLSDIVAPESFMLSGEGKAGPVGFGKVSARVELVEDGSETVLTYKVKADIGGKLAQLGGGMIERTSKKLSSEFFQNLEVLVAPAASAPVVAPAAPALDSAGSGSHTNVVLIAGAAVVAAAAAVALYMWLL